MSLGTLNLRKIRLCLGAKVLNKPSNFLLMTILLKKNIKMQAQSRTIHHTIHQHTSVNPNMWVTSFPKGDYRSQRMLDSEATHTWEM